MSEGLDRFDEATRLWFAESFGSPTPAQAGAWDAIRRGAHALVVAPTGSGKTLAAFLAAIDALVHGPTRQPGAGTAVLYISPLKALAVDVERNLRSPLVGISRVAARLGAPFRDVTVGVRSGDTPPQERRRLITSPPDILITTPESLFLMLTSAARESLRDVRTVIIDEVHAVAGTKRGAHLALSIERLDDLAEHPAQRIGLSATVRPHDEVARFVGGGRPVSIVAPPSPSYLELEVAVPVDDMTAIPPLDPDGDEPGGSIWPHVEAEIIRRVSEHRTTIVFANSRGLAERLTSRLNDAWPEDNVLARAHHGSVSKEQRELIENDLKSGALRCVVATSSLELGIDMGAVDLVIQVSTPPSVASGLQRVGRAGHQVGETSRGTIFPLSRQDLLGATVTAQRMRDGLIEALAVPSNPLDVLAQQTVAATALEPIDVEQWFDTVRRSAPFAALPRSAFEATLDLLSGRYPSDVFGELRPRLVWDREAGKLTGRPGAQRLAVTSGGTIPDRGLFTVVLPPDPDSRSPRRVGELDEEMVYESRINDVISLGASSWRIQEITHDRVIVTPAPGLPARLPFWKGDSVGRSAELGEAIGAFVREFTPTADDRAGVNLAAFLRDQAEATGSVPTDRTLVVERYRDELGDWRILLHSPYGRRVHAPWALAVGARIIERYGVDGSVVAGDDGIVARVPDLDAAELPGAELFVFEPDELERLVTEQVGGSALFASRFRECAARALLLPRRNPGARAPLWQQRQRASQLLEVAREHPEFPILLETARECLQDVYDVPYLDALTRRIARREVDLVEVTTQQPSPFAQNLVFGYVAAFLYEGDSPLAERRAAALQLDPTMLAELLGRTEMRELLDPDVIVATEAELQRLAPDRKLTGVEGVADLVRTLGPLTVDEVSARLTDGEAAAGHLATLRDTRRAIEVSVAGEQRWAAIEDAGRLRDALGTVIPMGIPDAHLTAVADPLGDLMGRFARTHGPFTAGEAATRWGIGVSVATGVLRRLARDGRLTEGEFRPSATGTEWVDPGILRRLRSRSLAAARQQVEPVDAEAYARFLASWHRIGSKDRGADAVLATVEQLAGLALPASAWETFVLPTRVSDYSPAMLDELLVAGEVIWSGAGTLAGSDGWVQLHPADLVLSSQQEITGERAAAVLDALSGGGAFRYDELVARLGDDDGSLRETLWSLVWAGRVSNDSWAPIRSLLGGRGAHRTAARPPRSRPFRPRPVRPLAQPILAGRWFALPPPPEPTALAVARAETLLLRHGVVTRGAVAAEQTPGGFAGVYRVLRELEQTGACLRGYYIDGLGAAQFAAPASVDRLRSHVLDPDTPVGTSPAIALAATDPANPHGAALAWPPGAELGHRPARKAGSIVVLHEGHLILYLERGGRKALSFNSQPQRVAAAASALVEVVRRGAVRRVAIESVDGVPVGSTAWDEPLRDAGFHRHPKGLRIG
ncbi:MAG: DEAD/DEAH box helicase [Aeromicrobium sp.]